MRLLTIAGLVLALLAPTVPAMAQAGPGATVVAGSTCPSTNVLNVGNNRPLVETQQGSLCSSASFSGSITATTTAVASASAPTYTAGAQPLSQDLAGNLRIGGSFSLSGSTSNAGSGVATSSTNNPSVDYLYGFNGTTWDQLQVNGSKALKVDASGATVPVSGTFWQTTQPVSGTVAFSNTTLAVTNAGTFAVQNTAATPAGTNLMGKVGIDQTTVGTTNGVSLAQINATTTLAGNGVTGTGSQRVTIASDNTAFAVNANLQAGTNLVGKVGLDQTTPGTTNAVAANAATSSGQVQILQADTSAPINISTATTTQLVALSSGKKIYITSWDVIAGGTGNITLEYGTGTACATGTTVLTGAYNLTAQTGLSKGSGAGPVLVVPASNALCALTSAAVQMSGSLSYAQF